MRKGQKVQLSLGRRTEGKAMINESEIECPDCGSKNVEPVNSKTGEEWECLACGYSFDRDDIDDQEEE